MFGALNPDGRAAADGAYEGGLFPLTPAVGQKRKSHVNQNAIGVLPAGVVEACTRVSAKRAKEETRQGVPQ